MSLELTAKYWNAFLSARPNKSEGLSTTEVELMSKLKDIAYYRFQLPESVSFDRHKFQQTNDLSSSRCAQCGLDIGNMIHL